MNIAVTGLFLSGKSTFSKILSKKLEYEYFDSDEYVHNLYKQEKIIKKIVDNFGNSIYKENKFQKKILSDLVFSSLENLRKLESIIIPEVKKEIIRLVKDTSRDLIFEVPLLYENALDSLMDFSILVMCSEVESLKRAHKRGYSKKDFFERIKYFMNDQQKLGKNPIIVKNEGSINNLNEQADQIITYITN